MPNRALHCLALALVAILFAGPLAAQQGVQRILLQSHTVPGSNLEFLQMRTEIGPNIALPRHTHPGPEILYVLQGHFSVEAEGAPTRLLGRGQTAYNPPGIPHGGRAGPAGAALLLTWVVPQGRPLAAPAKAGKQADGSPATRTPLPTPQLLR